MKRTIYDEDHEAFRQSVKEFVDRTLAPRAEEMIRDHVIARDIWEEAGAQGFFGLSIPEEFGGAGIDDYRFNAVFAEEIGRFTNAAGSCFGIHADITAPYLVHLGTEEQKQRWLPDVAAGKKIMAIGMTEPSGGSDLAALKSTAVRDGDDWVINGSKTFITNGHQCDLAVVAVRTDPTKGAKGISLFVLEAGMEGFTKGNKLDKVGQEESDTSELFFENVSVSNDHLLGPEGMGFIEMKPVSSGPTRSSLLTRTSSKDSSAVSESSWPTLSRTRPTLKPSSVVSTAKSEMPLAFFSGAVRAATRTMSAEPPLVMKVLDPLMIQSSPSRTAVVLRLARSEPPPGSVMPMARRHSPVAILGSQRSFCSWVPSSTM